MDKNQFIKIQKLTEELKTIDDEILRIQKIALQTSEQQKSISIKIELEEAYNKKKKKILDEEGNLISDLEGFFPKYYPMFRFSPQNNWNDENQKPAHTHEFYFSISETLLMLQQILSFKLKQKDEIVKQIQKFGVKWE